jgi:hypothetical protein
MLAAAAGRRSRRRIFMALNQIAFTHFLFSSFAETASAAAATIQLGLWLSLLHFAPIELAHENGREGKKRYWKRQIA